MLRIGVTDDGRGGADPARGTGLRGDRASARRVRRRARAEQPARRTDRRSPGDPVRIVIAEDLFLLRDGLTRMLEAHGLEIGRGRRQRGRPARRRDRRSARRRHRRRPAAAYLHRRGPPGGAGRPARGARPAGAWCCPSTSSSSTPANCWPAAPAASATCLKDRVFDSAQFVEAVRRVAAGGTAMDPEVIARLLARNTGNDAVSALSPREREVLGLMAEGRSNAAIAQRLVITERAVAKHTASIFLRLGLQPSEDDNRRVLAVLAYLGT